MRDVEKEHVLAVLRPIWATTNETASRLRGRIELVLSYAMQAGYRPEGLNPARWRGGLDKLLAAGTDPERLQSGPVSSGKQKNGKVVTAELTLELVGGKPFTDSGDDSAMAQGRRKPGEL